MRTLILQYLATESFCSPSRAVLIISLVPTSEWERMNVPSEALAELIRRMDENDSRLAHIEQAFELERPGPQPSPALPPPPTPLRLLPLLQFLGKSRPPRKLPSVWKPAWDLPG